MRLRGASSRSQTHPPQAGDGGRKDGDTGAVSATGLAAVTSVLIPLTLAGPDHSRLHRCVGVSVHTTATSQHGTTGPAFKELKG